MPASTELLGLFVEALEAARYAKSAKARALRDRTSRRCFSGCVRTRHWCCRLSGLIEFLRNDGLIDDTCADDVARELGMFLPFAAAIIRWNALGPTSQATVRAHLRIGALELASKVQLLRRAGLNFGISGDATLPPAWLEPVTRSTPLADLLAAAGTPSLRSIAKAIGFGEHAVGRWFHKGERPSREALQVLAKYFAQSLGEDSRAIYRELYWHYALRDVVRGLNRWLMPEEADDLARVAAAVARCRGQSDTIARPKASAIFVSLIAPPAFLVEHAIRHGAGRDWADDATDVIADYERAGMDGIHDPHAQLALLLNRLPRRRGHGGPAKRP